jgi:hypothetical protein
LGHAIEADIVYAESLRSQRGTSFCTEIRALPNAKKEQPNMIELTTGTERQDKVRNSSPEIVVLRTESREDLARILEELTRDVDPQDSIERMYVRDIAHHDWEIMRFRRVKTGILNNAMRFALQSILRQIQFPPAANMSLEIWLAPEKLAYDWLVSQEARDRVFALLQEAGLDMSAIEAEAYRFRADDIEKADRQLLSAAAARERTLRSVVRYRKEFARQLRQSSDRVLAAEAVPSIANTLPEN